MLDGPGAKTISDAAIEAMNEHGYHGPIHILVGMNMSGVLTGVVVDYDSEPYGYF